MKSTGWIEVPFEVQKPQHGLRVDCYLAARLHRYSRSRVQRFIAEGRVFLRGGPAKASARVADGDTVIVRYPHREEPPARHAALPVIYEDEDLLAINKPGDVISHPTDKVVANTVTSILRKQFPAGSLHLLHRLDRETSGIVLLSRNIEAARSLVEQFANRHIQKEYLALVEGPVKFRRKTVELSIGREGLEIQVRQKAVLADVGESAESLGAQPAVTEFLRLESNSRYSLIRAIPKTGRLHQIRVHLAAIGHPVVGDKLYIGDGEAYLKATRHELTAHDTEILGAPRQMLHAWRIRFIHPRSGRTMHLSAAPPQDFLERAAKLLPDGKFDFKDRRF